jgi:outer membrane protein TolC
MRAGFVALAVIATSSAVVRADDAPLTFDRAIKLALARNERSGIAELDVVVAQAGIEKARVAFLPVLALNGADTYAPWDKSPHNVANARLTLNQPLINPPAWPLYSQAKHNLASQRAQSTDDKRQLAFDAAKAYLSVLLADEVVQAAQKKLDTAKANVDTTDAQFKAQLVSSNDVTRAQVDLASSHHELASDQGNLESAYVALAFVINNPVTPRLTPPAALLAASERPIPAVDTLVAASLKLRPDLVARHEAALAAHDFAKEPRYRFLPTLGLQSTLLAQSTNTASGHELDGNIAVTASWTLYDAGARFADAHARDAQAAIADLTTDALGRSIDAQVRAASVQLAASQQALAASRDAMTAAQKSADETAILYKQGLAKAIELVDANEQRFLAEVAFAEARFALASAYLALLQAMGKGPLDEELP